MYHTLFLYYFVLNRVMQIYLKLKRNDCLHKLWQTKQKATACTTFLFNTVVPSCSLPDPLLPHPVSAEGLLPQDNSWLEQPSSRGGTQWHLGRLQIPDLNTPSPSPSTHCPPSPSPHHKPVPITLIIQAAPPDFRQQHMNMITHPPQRSSLQNLQEAEGGRQKKEEKTNKQTVSSEKSRRCIDVEDSTISACS